MSRITASLHQRVVDILRQAATRIVMPRFQRLQHGDVQEKAKDELVTVADHESEAFIGAQLLDALPGSRVIGEEACAADASRLDGMRQGRVWLVDPLDGTANFVAGGVDFALMAALLDDGVAIGAWILHPVSGDVWTAELGAGAFCNGHRVQTTRSSRPAHELHGAVLTRFLPPELRERIQARAHRVAHCGSGMRCAGAEYPAIARDLQQFALFWRTLPWDHVPGALLLGEAGGHVARLDGSPYRAGDEVKGLLAAGTRAEWETVRAALLEE